MPEDIQPLEERARPRSQDAENTNLVKDLYFGSVEKSFYQSSDDPGSLYNPFNPDDLYQKMGNYTIYEEMENDDQIAVCLQLKEDLILGSGFEIVCEEEGQEEVKWDIERALSEDADRSFDEMLGEILTANRFGFSISEKIFQKRADGSLTLRDIKTRHPNTWRLNVDPQGRVIEYKQTAGLQGDVVLDPKSLIHFINRSRFGNPYGKSDLREAYNAWFVKRHITRFYSIFLEKAASPTPIGKYDAVKTTKSDVDDVFNALKRLQTKSAMVIPNSIEIDFLESSNNGEAFVKGINTFNMFLGRALLIPDLMGFQGEATAGGSYSLGQQQIDVFIKHIERRRQALERAINKHIIQPIVVWNWGMLPHFPKFVLKPISESNAFESAKLFLQAVNGKLYKPTEDEINHFRSIIDFPQSDEVEIMPGVGAAQNNPFQRPDPEKEFDEEEEQEEKGNEEKPEEEEQDAAGNEEKVAEEKIKEEEKKEFAFQSPRGDFHRKVDFKVLETQMQSNTDRMLKDAQPIMKEMFKDLAEQIKKKNIVQGQKVQKIDTIKIKPALLKKLAKVLGNDLTDHYKQSQTLAQSEIFKSKFTLPLPSDEFFELLDVENLKFIGDWEYNVTKNAKQQIINALKDGKPVSSVVDLLTSEGLADSEVALERYARTKTTEVMNRARHDFFESTEVVSGYQYSAILDERTSDICAGLHGTFFAKGTEPVPPMHFNCRSLLIPITVFEKFEPTKSIDDVSVNEFIEENIGKGFSRN
jgi:SPP1 gp7 family putative phage head morphogenesis protein